MPIAELYSKNDGIVNESLKSTVKQQMKRNTYVQIFVKHHCENRE